MTQVCRCFSMAVIWLLVEQNFRRITKNDKAMHHSPLWLLELWQGTGKETAELTWTTKQKEPINLPAYLLLWNQKMENGLIEKFVYSGLLATISIRRSNCTYTWLFQVEMFYLSFRSLEDSKLIHLSVTWLQYPERGVSWTTNLLKVSWTVIFGGQPVLTGTCGIRMNLVQVNFNLNAKDRHRTDPYAPDDRWT